MAFYSISNLATSSYDCMQKTTETRYPSQYWVYWHERELGRV